ncbi:ligase-associated DNA damage response endonuclease PdeM [Nitrospirillum sp. BR 11828]|uniref:ligase-associated DNA damage response endonuclease PdeM n=1 Tax=Nitrospirillum sp. BR 11828 TaxID=3104325 RepID=UPI002ACAB305|nr:ligase-associated DNA damage response endonuclease PdeM [Nitrospirillum sp. BR 11828]MDZ5646111.1 ligase-associated DNA damage response endonuclease PdeM [Nitrospirillum sp. BR 11828]
MNARFGTGSAGDQTALTVNGATVLADASGALFWPDRGLLVVADLHLEKGSAFAARGTLLPPYDTAATLARLEATCRRLAPRRVLCLGDSFHDPRAGARVSADDGRRLAGLIQAHDWLWVVGNHDPAPPPDWGGQVVDDWVEGPLVFRHEAQDITTAGEISGHYHPKASVPTRARRVGGRCFITDGHRLVLPAFGAYTGGLDVRDAALRRLFPGAFSIVLLHRDRGYAFQSAHILGDDWPRTGTV